MGAFLDVAVLVKRERWMSGIVDSDVSMPGKARQHPQLRAQAEPGQQTTFAVTGTVLR